MEKTFLGLEPAAREYAEQINASISNFSLISIAVSMKRIADKLEECTDYSYGGYAIRTRDQNR